MDNKQIHGVTDASDIPGYMYLVPAAAARDLLFLLHPYGLVDAPGDNQSIVIVGLSVLMLDLDKELLLV